MAYGYAQPRSPVVDINGNPASSTGQGGGYAEAGGGRIGPGTGGSVGGADVTPTEDPNAPKWRDDAQMALTDADYRQWRLTTAWSAGGGDQDPAAAAAAMQAAGREMDASGLPSGTAPAATPPTPPVTFDPSIAGMDQRQAYINQLLGSAGGRAAPSSAAAMLGPAALAQDSEFRARQLGVADQMGRLASGQDSISALQLRDALGRNVAQQRALAASARPGQGAMAQRIAAQQAGQMGGNLAGQQALAGIQERTAAGNALQNLLGTARGQDLALSQFNTGQTNQQALNAAQLLQQNNQFNAQAGLQQQGLNDSMVQGLLGQQIGGMGLQQQGNLSAAQLLAQQRQQELELQNRLQLAQSGDGGKDWLNGLLGAAKVGLSLYGQSRGGGGGGSGADPSYGGYGSAPY